MEYATRKYVIWYWYDQGTILGSFCGVKSCKIWLENIFGANYVRFGIFWKNSDAKGTISLIPISVNCFNTYDGLPKSKCTTRGLTIWNLYLQIAIVSCCRFVISNRISLFDILRTSEIRRSIINNCNHRWAWEIYTAFFVKILGIDFGWLTNWKITLKLIWRDNL